MIGGKACPRVTGPGISVLEYQPPRLHAAIEQAGGIGESRPFSISETIKLTRRPSLVIIFMTRASNSGVNPAPFTPIKPLRIPYSEEAKEMDSSIESEAGKLKDATYFGR
jgi:hypothetical protein